MIHIRADVFILLKVSACVGNIENAMIALCRLQMTQTIRD